MSSEKIYIVLYREAAGEATLREKEITNIPLLDVLLYPTSLKSVSVAGVAQVLFFRGHKFLRLSHMARPVVSPRYAFPSRKNYRPDLKPYPQCSADIRSMTAPAQPNIAQFRCICCDREGSKQVAHKVLTCRQTPSF